MKIKCFVYVWIGLAAAEAYGLLLENPNLYVMQTYAQYARPDSGQAKYVEFDGAGNLYVTHDGGSLVRINSSGQSGVLSRYRNLQGICYAGGTTYGDMLYFNDAGAGRLYARRADGTTTTLCTFSGQPIGIAIDKLGAFNGKMLVPVRYSNGDVYKISETGQKELFLRLGAGWSGHDIESDPSGAYGGLMYMSVSDPSDTFSVWAVRPNGTAGVFCNTTLILDLEFDTTQIGAFGGLLYGRRSSWAIGSISPDGQWTRFAGSSDTAIQCMTFGPDNSMYVVEEVAGNMVLVTKISAVPEPATALLLGLGGLLVRLRIKN